MLTSSTQITPVVKKWCIPIKSLVAAPTLLVVSRFMSLTAGLLESKWYGNCIFGPIFVKLASDFNLNIYHLASYF